jgi:iron complex outermembrane receptor protein
MTLHPLKPHPTRALLAACLFLFCSGLAAFAADDARKPFNLPADSAEKSLKKFSIQSGLEVLFATDNAAGVKTNAVKGDFTPREAVQRLLAGTALAAALDEKTGTLTVSRVPNGSRAAVAGPTATTAAPSDEVVTLAEFNVTGEDDGSYVPSESTTGSRVNAKIKDLPYTVSVLTSEFFRDFSIFEATDELSYMSSISGVDDGGNLNMRGFNGGTVNLRNGLASNGLIDTASLDRVEVIQGPAAAIYGQTSPSGTMVITTKKPTRTPHYGLQVSTGSYSLNQVIANASGPLGHSSKLFYRLDTQYYHRLYEVPGIASTTRSITGTIIYRASPNTSVTLEAGYLLRLNVNGGGLPFNFDNTAKRYTGGYAFETVHKIIANPVDLKPRWNAVFGTSVEHRFNAIFAGKVSASVNHRPLVNYSSFGGSQYDAALNRIVNGSTSISYSKDDFDYRNLAIDLTATYPLRGTKQRTLFTVDYAMQNRRGYNTSSTTAFNNLNPTLKSAQKEVDTTASLIPYQPVSADEKGGPNFNPLTYNKDNNIAATGFFVRQESTMLRDRLIAVAGYRHDYIRGDFREPGNGFQRKLHDLNDALLLGLTYRVTSNLSWFVGRNESFSPLSITTSANPTSTLPRTTRGVGYDTGLKGELLEGRLGFTAHAYDTRRENEQVTEVDPATNQTFTSYIGNTKTRGFGFEGNYRLTDTFQSLISYTHNDARAVNQGRDVNAEGRHTKGTPLDAFSAALRYQALPSLSLTLGVRYTAKTPAFGATDSPGPADAVTKLITTNPNGSRDIYTPSSTIWTAGATYRWKSRKVTNLSHAVTVTGKNLTDRLYIIPGNNRTVGDRIGVYLTYAISH